MNTQLRDELAEIIRDAFDEQQHEVAMQVQAFLAEWQRTPDVPANEVWAEAQRR